METDDLFLKWRHDQPYFTDGRHYGDCILLFFERDLSLDITVEGTTLALRVVHSQGAVRVELDPPAYDVLEGKAELGQLVSSLNLAVQEHAEYDLSGMVTLWQKIDPYFSFFVVGSG